MKYFINQPEELYSVANTIFQDIYNSQYRLIALKGQLGSGKTTFMQYLLQSLNYNQVITSPTFPIMNIYNLKDLNIVHMDFYREALLYEELEEVYMQNNNYLFIEWYELAPYAEQISPNLTITIQILDNNKRQITIT